jgi:hypothetical protein
MILLHLNIPPLYAAMAISPRVVSFPNDTSGVQDSTVLWRILPDVCLDNTVNLKFRRKMNSHSHNSTHILPDDTYVEST